MSEGDGGDCFSASSRAWSRFFIDLVQDTFAFLALIVVCSSSQGLFGQPSLFGMSARRSIGVEAALQLCGVGLRAGMGLRTIF